MSLFKSNTAIIATFALSFMISASDTQAQTATTTTSAQSYTENGVTVSVDVKGIYEMANKIYPGLFRTPSVLREYQGYVYRYYRDSGNYIGIKDGQVYLMGKNFGNTLTPTAYGNVNAVIGDLRTAYRARFGQDFVSTVPGSSNPNPTTPVVTIPDVNIPEGDFKLTITGRYESSLISLNIPSIVIEKMPAPDPNDVEAQLKVMRDQGIQNIRNTKLVVINNSSSRVTFSLEFQGDITGLGTVTYRLNYDYTK